jgi:hypothetical protein
VRKALTIFVQLGAYVQNIKQLLNASIENKSIFKISFRSRHGGAHLESQHPGGRLQSLSSWRDSPQQTKTKIGFDKYFSITFGINKRHK